MAKKVTRPEAPEAAVEAAEGAVTPEEVQPGATESGSAPPWRGPYRADGVKVLDRDGRTVCMCLSTSPLDFRVGGAVAISHLMNTHGFAP